MAKSDKVPSSHSLSVSWKFLFDHILLFKSELVRVVLK